MASSLSGIKKGPDETLSIPSYHVDNSAMVNKVINTKISQVKEYLNTELTNINYTLSKYIKETKTEADSGKNNNDRIYSINTKVMSLEERLESHFHKLSSELNCLNSRFKELENNFQKQLKNNKTEMDRLCEAYIQIGELRKGQESNFTLLQNEFNNVINTRLNDLEMRLNQKIEQNGQIDMLQTRIIEANEPIIKRIVELESQLTTLHEQPYPLSMEEPPQFIVMPHQTIRNDDELIRNELFRFTQIIQGMQMDNHINQVEEVEFEPRVEPNVEELRVEPNVEELRVEPNVEELRVEPNVEEPRVEPNVEEVNTALPMNIPILEHVNKSEEIGVNEIIVNESSIPLNLPIKLMKNKKPKKK
jgi:hypothetical protein